ncbi:YwqG family protein [Lederbergia lenta]|uniref:Cytoplasmic protein n=1 Tax=Lederbergia lenta TaxID=1467 RepID=A0A2X4YXD2_LEDLE|nr:YwqG family protein [Lederbergia lenta]MEC2326620.1 YwqG family protein [Lederbergia lenta]SQI53014.1 cytoplasmic protein [Lederbergia lenta]
MKLPKQLQPYAEALAETKIPSININGEIKRTTPLESKFGGQPYWLKADAYPTSKSGEALRLLAQINFSEIKVSIPGYPTEGILQFFVAGDDVYGLDFDDMTNQDTFRVVFHENIESDESKWLTVMPDFDDENYFPVEKECALSFDYSNEIVSRQDYRFNVITQIDKILEDATDEDYELYDEMMEAYDELTNEQGSKLGGYPFFTQEDPRTYGDYPTFDTLLLQIDTEQKLDIMWGDSGVANFFIALEDLKKRDFSKVLYNWDCY